MEKINKIDKPLARFIKKKREKNQINEIRNEKGGATTDNAKIQTQRLTNTFLNKQQVPEEIKGGI